MTAMRARARADDAPSVGRLRRSVGGGWDTPAAVYLTPLPSMPSGVAP
jgi:hypothetical protein